MKKFALIAATLICFAGCARNDTEDMTATEIPSPSTDTAVGTPAVSQTDTMTDTNSSSIFDTNQPGTLSIDTNSNSDSSSLNLDTNATLYPPPLSSGEQLTPAIPPPTPPDESQELPQTPPPNP